MLRVFWTILKGHKLKNHKNMPIPIDAVTDEIIEIISQAAKIPPAE